MIKSLVRSIVGLLGREARGRVITYSPLSFNELDLGGVKRFVYEWNNSFPIDRWWREKHGVAFNSERHREVSFLDMRVEWEEDQVYARIRNAEEYHPNTGDYLKEETQSTEILSEEERFKRFLEEEKDFDYSRYVKTVEQPKS